MTRDDIIRMAQEAGFYIDPDWIEHGLPGFENFAHLVAAAEREASAKVCEQMSWPGRSDEALWKDDAAEECAKAIRARSLK